MERDAEALDTARENLSKVDFKGEVVSLNQDILFFNEDVDTVVMNPPFGTKDQHLKAWKYEADLLPPENLLTNYSFEDDADGLPAGWTVTPRELVHLGRFAH